METTRQKLASSKPGRPPKALPKVRSREATMERLMEAGVKVFSTYGYDAATTKLVAKEAEINESLINRYFDGKSGLLLAIIKSYLEAETKEKLACSYAESTSVREEILAYCQYKLDYLIKQQSFFKIVISRAIVDPVVGEELKKMAKCASPILLERLQKLQKKGAIRRDIDLERASTVIGQTAFAMGFFKHIVMGVDRKFVMDSLSDFARDYTRGIGPST